MERGLTFRVNPLFLLVIGLFAVTGMLIEAILAFLLVILHEFVHIIVAFYYGYNVNKLELFPFGGMAEYNGLLEMEPAKEIKVALAGPFFNLLVGGLLFLLMINGFLPREGFLNADITRLLIEYNLVIATVNFLPALPLDGGRVLRAILVSRTGFEKGSRQAVKIAKITALFIGISGVIVIILNRSNIWFLVLSFFVYGAASKEDKQIIYYLLSYLTRRERIVKKVKIKGLAGQVVRDELTIKEVLYALNPVKYNLFFVIGQDLSLKGILTEAELLGSFFRQQDKELRLIDIL